MFQFRKLSGSDFAPYATAINELRTRVWQQEGAAIIGESAMIEDADFAETTLHLFYELDGRIIAACRLFVLASPRASY